MTNSCVSVNTMTVFSEISKYQKQMEGVGGIPSLLPASFIFFYFLF